WWRAPFTPGPRPRGSNPGSRPPTLAAWVARRRPAAPGSRRTRGAEEDRVRQDVGPPRPPHHDPEEGGHAVERFPVLDRKRRRTGPDPDHASVPDQGQLDRLRGAVAHAHLGPHGEGRAGRRGERVARDPRPVAGDDREAVEHGRGPPLGPPDGVDASAPEGGDERRLALGRDEEDRLRGPDPLALPLPVEARLAHHPRGPAPLPPRVLSEEVVPPLAELRKASHVLVGAAEARVAERSQQVVAVRVGRAPDPEPEHPFLAVVE